MKKYKTERVSYRVEAKIEEVEVERETESCIWVEGRKRNKKSEWGDYHDTWEAAHEHLMASANEHVMRARRQLESLNGTLGNIKGMKRPE